MEIFYLFLTLGEPAQDDRDTKKAREVISLEDAKQQKQQRQQPQEGWGQQQPSYYGGDEPQMSAPYPYQGYNNPYYVGPAGNGNPLMQPRFGGNSFPQSFQHQQQQQQQQPQISYQPAQPYQQPYQTLPYSLPYQSAQPFQQQQQQQQPWQTLPEFIPPQANNFYEYPASVQAQPESGLTSGNPNAETSYAEEIPVPSNGARSWSAPQQAPVNSWAAPQQAPLNSWAAPQQAQLNSWPAPQQAPVSSWPAPQQDLGNSWQAPQQDLGNSWSAPQQGPVTTTWGAPQQGPGNGWVKSQQPLWSDNGNGNGNGNGVVPSWRRSFTPLPGQSGCYNRCRPSCSNNKGGCQPTCRSACNIKPSCPRRSQPQFAGSTMVCARPGYNVQPNQGPYFGQQQNLAAGAGGWYDATNWGMPAGQTYQTSQGAVVLPAKISSAMEVKEVEAESSSTN